MLGWLVRSPGHRQAFLLALFRVKTVSPYGWFTRILWPLAGGAWGAWVGFQGISRHFVTEVNRDSFALIFVLGFFALFAVVGFFVGAVSAVTVGGCIEWLLRRIGIGIVAAIGVASLVNALTLWQMTELLQSKYHGLSATNVQRPQRALTNGEIAPVDKGAHEKPCSALPPTAAKERAMWDAECR